MRPGFPEHMAPTSAAEAAAHTSAWRSPVPYLFGGLAAMLGLIAFALLILACSYWRISGFLDPPDADADTDTPTSTSAASAKPAGHESAPPSCLGELGFVVIMAGDSKPTFLATPRPPFGSLLDSTTAGKLTAGAAEDDDDDDERKASGEFITQHQH